MPSSTIFDKQPVDYRKSVITPGVPTVSIEALGYPPDLSSTRCSCSSFFLMCSTASWEKYSHYQICMRSFGASAPIKVRHLFLLIFTNSNLQDLYEHFGFTPDKVCLLV